MASRNRLVEGLVANRAAMAKLEDKQTNHNRRKRVQRNQKVQSKARRYLHESTVNGTIFSVPETIEHKLILSSLRQTQFHQNTWF